jgi:hypothetical protein
MVIKSATTTAEEPRTGLGDSQMRTLSFMVALAFALVGPSMIGSADTGLPGIGTFSYNGSPIATTASHSVVVAAR